MNVLVVHVAAVTHATDTDGAVKTCGEGERTSATRGMTEGPPERERSTFRLSAEVSDCVT